MRSSSSTKESSFWRSMTVAFPTRPRCWQSSDLLWRPREALARMTSQYGDVYWRAIDSRCCRSLSDKITRNGLFSGIGDNPPDAQSTRHRISKPLKYVTVFENRSTKYR